MLQGFYDAFFPRSQEALDYCDRYTLDDLPDEVLNQIVARSDGVPLFVEELTKAVLEGGNAGVVLDSPPARDALLSVMVLLQVL